MPDLITIAGIPELWTCTKGDPRIKIAILDGPADLERACFVGANLTQIKPYWAEDIELNQEYFYYLKLIAEFNQQQNAKKQDPDYDKDQSAKETEAFFATIPKPIRERFYASNHATHISSTILGQHGTPVPGIAPYCTAINIPIAYDSDNFNSLINLTHAINTALKHGANIIHIAVCLPTQTGVTPDLLARAVKQCLDNNILIVVPGGNNQGECWCVPAIIEGVLTVGAMRDDGQPFKFSNYGSNYQKQGVITYGENILGAQPGTDEPIRQKGTSCAAPIVTGISALLMSIQRQRGEQPNAEAVRQAILKSAIPCNPKEIEEPERCLLGKLNIPGAYQFLTGERLTSSSLDPYLQPLSHKHPSSRRQPFTPSNPPTEEITKELKKGQLGQATAGVTHRVNSQTATINNPAISLTPSQKSNLVYVLGTLGYQLGPPAPMIGVDNDQTSVPANLHDARQMADYLAQNPTEAKSLIWTVNQELTPIYALEAKGPFADDIYETLQQVLVGQTQPPDSEDYIERVSFPGKLTGKTVKLFSGQVVPVLTLPNIRGMYGWKVNCLVDAALPTVSQQVTRSHQARIRKSLRNFLQRVYYELRNLGQTSKDRALNFAATNVFQAVSSFAQAVSTGMELDSIEVEKSPFCRLGSDCWDIKLMFFDPDNGLRAKKVYLFTIDVSDLIPVTSGQVRSWSIPK